MKKMNKIELYEGVGFCEYVDHLGSDWRVVEAARTSYGRQALKGEEQDTKLLRYLITNRHTSPFEQCNITFLIKMPIFVMRQFVRHRTFRLNEMSGRYMMLPDQFYIPKEWRSQDKDNKQGSNPDGGLNNKSCSELAKKACENSYLTYEQLLAEGVATEMARLVLPVNIMTQIMVNIDLHNLMHFFNLRIDAHAQKEIQDLAKAMHRITKDKFPVIIEAYDELVRPKFVKE